MKREKDSWEWDGTWILDIHDEPQWVKDLYNVKDKGQILLFIRPICEITELPTGNSLSYLLTLNEDGTYSKEELFPGDHLVLNCDGFVEIRDDEEYYASWEDQTSLR